MPKLTKTGHVFLTLARRNENFAREAAHQMILEFYHDGSDGEALLLENLSEYEHLAELGGWQSFARSVWRGDLADAYPIVALLVHEFDDSYLKDLMHDFTKD